MRVRLLGIVVLVFCLVSPVFAADRVIQNGIDVWVTKAAGKTFVEFSNKPIPAGFFCPGSAAFTGTVALRGVPIVTGAPGELGGADTIVQRLDDAVFDKRGVAVTRIQVRALSLKSVEPVQTSCGKFDVSVALEGAQPTTRMRIVRDNEQGGRYFAPLSLNTRVTFTPVGRVGGEALEVLVPVRFPAAPNSAWQMAPGAPKAAGFVLVDTDGDRSPDTYLPGMSNFIAGKASRPALNKRPGRLVGGEDKGGETTDAYWVCHDGDGCQHCYYHCPPQEYPCIEP